MMSDEKPVTNGDIIDGFSDLSEQASFLSYRAYAAGFITAERYYNIEPPEYSSYDASQMWSEWLDKEGVDYECHSVNVDVNTAVLELIARDSVPEGAMTTTIQSMTISQTVKEILSA